MRTRATSKKVCLICEKDEAVVTAVVLLTSIGVREREQQCSKSAPLCGRCLRFWCAVQNSEMQSIIGPAIALLTARYARIAASEGVKAGEKALAESEKRRWKDSQPAHPDKKKWAPPDGAVRIRLLPQQRKRVVELIRESMKDWGGSPSDHDLLAKLKDK